VLAVVLQAVVRVGGRALKNNVLIGIAVAAFVAIFFFDVAFPIIIIVAGVVGWIGGRTGSALFQGGGHGGAKKGIADADSLLGETLPDHARLSVAGSLRAASVWLALWLVPVVLVLATAGVGSTFGQISIFFSKMAVVTFGGAYAVLAYVAQQAVEQYHWLRPGEMLDGLGMAETTPGPLILVTQFVGFMAAYRDSGALNPIVAGTLGGLLTTWVTFMPCFLWIFLGAPFIEALRGNKALGGALTAITAAVVGVILNLAIWFALHTWFRMAYPVHAFGFSFDAPVISSLDPWALALSAAAVLAIFRFKAGMIPTLLACSLAGIILHAVGVTS
jgi:chromate transporter